MWDAHLIAAPQLQFVTVSGFLNLMSYGSYFHCPWAPSWPLTLCLVVSPQSSRQLWPQSASWLPMTTRSRFWICLLWQWVSWPVLHQLPGPVFSALLSFATLCSKHLAMWVLWPPEKAPSSRFLPCHWALASTKDLGSSVGYASHMDLVRHKTYLFCNFVFLYFIKSPKTWGQKVLQWIRQVDWRIKQRTWLGKDFLKVLLKQHGKPGLRCILILVDAWETTSFCCCHSNCNSDGIWFQPLTATI